MPLTRFHPLVDVAKLLVGTARAEPDGSPRCVVVNEGHHRTLDVALEIPKDELGPIATLEIWAEVMDRIADLARGERTTLVFVNTRRLVERVAHLLSARLGEDQVVAHHGSLSRKTRHEAEGRLKRGEVKVCVATASLELGIDVGTVDLACQIGSPRSVAVFLQRVGRSGHGVGRVPKGRLFPLTRDELVECAALLRLGRRGELDRIEIPPWPLDILAQQIVAATACEPQDEDALYALARRSYPYRELPRERFDQVVLMLAEGFATSRGRRSALLHRDGVNRTLKPRRGARRDPWRPFCRRPERRAVRAARGGGRPACHTSRRAHGRDGGGVGVRPAEPRRHPHARPAPRREPDQSPGPARWSRGRVDGGGRAAHYAERPRCPNRRARGPAPARESGRVG